MLLSVEIAHFPNFPVVASRRVHSLTATAICNLKLQTEPGKHCTSSPGQDSNFPLFPTARRGCAVWHATNASAGEGEMVA